MRESNKDLEKKVSFMDSKLKSSFKSVKKDIQEIKSSNSVGQNIMKKIEEKLLDLSEELKKNQFERRKKEVTKDVIKEADLQRRIELLKLQLEREKQKSRYISTINNLKFKLQEKKELDVLKKGYEKKILKISKAYKENEKKLLFESEKNTQLIKDIENQRKNDFERFLKERDKFERILKKFEEKKEEERSIILKYLSQKDREIPTKLEKKGPIKEDNFSLFDQIKKSFENFKKNSNNLKRDKIIKRLSKKRDPLRTIKILILLIPFLIIGYILYSNFVASQEFVYFYDIGSEEDKIKPFLSPLDRISEANTEESYRNLTSQLVYFNVPIPRGSKSILIEARIFMPLNETIKLGARDKEEWSYLNKDIYNPFLESLNLQGKITRLNPEMPEINSIEEIPFGAVVATDLNLPLIPKKQDFEIQETTINHHLRSSHLFYIYLKDSLELYVEKQDINWYEGEDILNISLKDLEGNILGNLIIEDDGIIDTSKVIEPPKNGELKIQGLKEGVYILDIQGNSDTIITRINLNTNKIVSNRIFSADSSTYLREKDQDVSFYMNPNRNSFVFFKTFHENYLQNISINDNFLELKERGISHDYNLFPQEYYLNLPKSNIILESSSYITFSDENYFDPFEYIIVRLPSNKKELMGIDYLVIDYIPKKQDLDWSIVSAEFEIKDLYIKDGELSLMFNILHLAESRNETNIKYVPIDWIKSTIQKNGIFKI